MSLHVKYYHKHFDITVFAGGRGVVAKTCQELHVPFIQLPIDKLWKCLWGGPMLWWHLRKIRPAVVILHGQWAGPIGAIAARLAGPSRILYICHWPSFYTDWDLYRCLRNYVAEKIPCLLCDQVITVSESCGYQYQIRHLAEPPKLVCSTNPIDLTQTPTPEEAASFRAEHQWSKDQVHVVSVGRLVDQKRLDWLLHAWESVQKQTPQAILWIVGDGPELKPLQQLAHQLGIEATVHFVGSKPTAWKYIAASDLVVMTTIYEAQGRVALEAMACGRPIIANDVDGARDSFHHNVEGIYVPPSDIPALAEAIVKLVRSPELREQMGQRGRVQVGSFDQPLVLQKYFEIIYGYATEQVSLIGHIRSLARQHGVLRWVANFLESISGWKISLASVLLLGLVAWIDFAVGYKIGLLFFYGIPIALISLRFGSWTGIFFSLIATVAWFYSDVQALPDGWDYRISLWNASMRCATWIFFSGCLGSLNATIRHRDRLIDELQKALQKSRST
jgi:glycosyltransferase involved in cell wall biosynthesis